MKKWVFVFLIVVITGCEKTLNLQTDVQASKVVVDAQIEENMPPVVLLNTSLPYFSEFNVQQYLGSFIHNAKVTVSDGTQTVTLTENAVLTPDSSLYYYTVNPASLHPMVGVQGKQYALHIESGGQVFDAVTTIPISAKKIDSLSWKPSTDKTDTTRIALMAKITDPPGYGNYIRYFTKINRGQFLPGVNSVFDDQIIDGTTYTIQIAEGADKNFLKLKSVKDSSYAYFEKGDTLSVKFCNIDKSSFDFWRTWEYQYQSTGNPFSSPGKVLGNISNGALGAFCGYSVQVKTLIIPK